MEKLPYPYGIAYRRVYEKSTCVLFKKPFCNPLRGGGPTVALCIGTYGDPRGVGVYYERGTPVTLKGFCMVCRSRRGDALDICFEGATRREPDGGRRVRPGAAL